MKQLKKSSEGNNNTGFIQDIDGLNKLSIVIDKTRMYTKSYALILLILLKHNKPLCGLQITEISQERVPRGSVYVLLERMEELGFVKSEIDTTKPDTGKPRRYYWIDEVHKPIFEAWLKIMSTLQIEFDEENGTK